MPRHWFPLLVTAVAVAASPLALRQQQQQQNIGNESNWRSYVRSPSSSIVVPQAVLSDHTAGNVTNPDGLVGEGTTILSRLSLSEDVPTLVLDFGQNVVGQLIIDFAGSTTDNDTARPGLSLAFSETLQYLSATSDFSRSQSARGDQKVTAGSDQVAVDAAPYSWTDQLGCQHGRQVCADGLHGFRYVNISLRALDSDAPYTTSLGSISIQSVKLQFSGFLGTPDTFTGHFACSDDRITQWWYDAVYTNDLCTDVFRANDTDPRNANSSSLIGKLVLHDGAKRDRDPYIGDVAIAGLTSYLSHDLPEAARNVLEDVALHQTADGWIPPASINNYQLPLFDYPLWWVVSVKDHVLYTGNTDFLQSQYPVLQKALDNYYPNHTNSATGLIERPTSGSGDFAFVPRDGAVTYYNALYVLALQAAAELADALDNEADAKRWRDRADAVGPALKQRNWDSANGVFFDGGRCGGAGLCNTHAQDGNAISILAEAVDDDDADSILSYLSNHMAQEYGNAFYDNDALNTGYSGRVYAFMSYFEIAARFRKSPSTALDELRRLYGWMADHNPSITFWEGIGPGGVPYESGFTSMAHAWSTGIVPLAINYLLGVTPLEPGFQRWRLAPVINGTDLTWASGVVPTPLGPITVQWEHSSDFQIALVVDAPEGTRGEVTLPFAADSLSKVTVNGFVVFDEVDSDTGAVTLSVPGGRHQVYVS